MYKFTWFALLILCIFTVSIIFLKPLLNATDPGCSGGPCHDLSAGMISVTPQNNLQVEVFYPASCREIR